MEVDLQALFDFVWWMQMKVIFIRVDGHFICLHSQLIMTINLGLLFVLFYMIMSFTNGETVAEEKYDFSL